MGALKGDLTIKGIDFIESTCNNDANILSGKRDTPFGYLGEDITYTSIINYNGLEITTPQQYSKLLIESFNKYGREYGLDSNILAAQAYQESSFRPWNYSSGNAMGVSQFIPISAYDVLINNPATKKDFSSEELGKLLNGLVDPIYKNKRYWKLPLGNSQTEDQQVRNNVNQVFENLRNNPDLCIKMQASYMRFISLNNNGLASSTLMAYNRGGYYRSKTYGEMINNVINGKTKIEEGANYVERIFRNLGNSFGYEDMIDFNIIDITKNSKPLFLE